MNSVYHRAAFSASAHTLKQLPDGAVAEVAFSGRSNAGKSSAINALCRNNQLARTSRTPGRTQLINHFHLTQGRYLVDLPGYGYAKVSKSQTRHWEVTLSRYLVERDELRALIVVIDSRRGLTDLDWRLIEFQQQGTADLHLLLTKYDKLNQREKSRLLPAVSEELSAAGIEATLQTFSATNGHGIGDLHHILDVHLFDETLDLDAGHPA